MIPLMMQKDYQPKGWREYQLGALRIIMLLVAGHCLMPLTCDAWTGRQWAYCWELACGMRCGGLRRTMPHLLSIVWTTWFVRSASEGC
jgi:hypothetical protein